MPHKRRKGFAAKIIPLLIGAVFIPALYYFVIIASAAAVSNRTPQFIVVENTSPQASQQNQTPTSLTIEQTPTITPPATFTLPAIKIEITPAQFALTPAVDTPYSSPIVVGTSRLGSPLEVYIFGSPSRPVKRLIVAGIHGGYEGNTVELAYQLIAFIHANPEAIPPHVTLFILPNLNPDGYASGGRADPDARANAKNVDLNRNFPYNWQLNPDTRGCFDARSLTTGTHPASEPETINLINFINLWKPDAIISYHSAALGIFAGGRPTLPASEALAEALASISTYPHPPINTGCGYTGNFTDWASSTLGIPAVDIELTNHLDTDLQMNLRILNVFLNWTYKETP